MVAAEVTTLAMDAPAYANVPLHLSSAGPKKVAPLSVLLAREPDILVLDEPTTNMSVSALRRVVTALDT